ncbi:MAG: aldehyde dehydrogenase family protein, partial [Gammaproteobacteria bacterium]
MAVTSLKSLHQGKELPDGGAALQIHSPYSQALLAEMQTATQQQLEQALAVGHAIATDRRRWLSVNERIAVLKKTAALMREEKQHLIATAVNEGGKPWQDSAVEVDRAIAGVELCISNLSGQAGEVIPLTSPSPEVSYTALTQRQPRGLVVAVSAFNHPLNLIVHQVGAAVAAGCPCIVKPAEPTPMSCHAFVEILYRAGLPEEYCQVVMPETLELATALVTDPRVAFFSFIGSARVGWMLRSKLAPGTRCALEHGGVAPVIVHSSAREEKVVRDVMK